MRVIFITFFLVAINAKAQKEVAPMDGVMFINNAFKKYPVVAIGESHALKEQYVFLHRLLQNNTFQNTVNDIVIEFGNSIYQPILDAYIRGDSVQSKELEKVWVNTTQSPVDPWSSILYKEFIAQVRKINRENKKRIRVIAGDPPIQWEEIHSRQDYAKYQSRDSVMAAITCEEVLKKKRKALLITGGVHLSKIHRPSPINRNLPVNLEIEKQFPASVLIIQTISGFGKFTDEYEPKLLPIPLESIFFIKDTWAGKIPLPSTVGPSRSVLSTVNTPQPIMASPAAPQATDFTREDVCDAFLYVGQLKDLHWIQALPSVYSDETFWKELNRRSKIRFNNELVPESRSIGNPRPAAYQ